MGVYDTTIGTIQVGAFLNTYLYGLVSYQFAAYYRTKFNDRPVTKYMVLLLFIVDTFHSLVATYMAWYFTAQNGSNPQVLEWALWPYRSTPIYSAITALVTQLYLGFRIWSLTGSKFLYGVVITLAIPSFVLSATSTIEGFIVNISEVLRIKPFLIAGLSMQVITDTFITVTLITIFSRWRGGMHRTDTILNRLARGAIQTGLLADIFSLGTLIAFVLLPDSTVSAVFSISIGRIYTNTLMDTLLTRDTIKAELACTHEFNEPSGLSWSPNDSNSNTASSARSGTIRDRVEGNVRRTGGPTPRVEDKDTPRAV